uniref:Uncharacterized protein n=1 Tax=Gossypium raimondii TaxID=29730 RepID=A0A0D2SFP6_GOSRA|nr:hypothetical protein B456_007G181700 [Gossypium raimondii]
MNIQGPFNYMEKPGKKIEHNPVRHISVSNTLHPSSSDIKARMLQKNNESEQNRLIEGYKSSYQNNISHLLKKRLILFSLYMLIPMYQKLYCKSTEIVDSAF